MDEPALPAAGEGGGGEPASTPSVTDTVSAAWDEVASEAPEETGGEVGAEKTKVAPPGKEAAPASAASGRDEKGRFTAAQKAEADAKAKAAKLGAVKEAPKLELVKPESKAPASWKLTTKEKWAALPEDVREEIARREKETSLALDKSAARGKLGQAFQEATAPYNAMIFGEGSDPIKAATRLFQTAYILRHGQPMQKVQSVADMIYGFGIDKHMEMLNDALIARHQGKNPANVVPQQGPGEFRDPRLDKLLAQVQERQNETQGGLIAEKEAAYETFAETHLGFDELRDEMADVIEARARRGLTTDDEMAYNMVARAHPEIQEVLSQREAAAAAEKARASTQRSRAASLTVRSQPAMVQRAPDRPRTVVDAVDAAWDSVSGQ